MRGTDRNAATRARGAAASRRGGSGGVGGNFWPGGPQCCGAGTALGPCSHAQTGRTEGRDALGAADLSSGCVQNPTLPGTAL